MLRLPRRSLLSLRNFLVQTERSATALSSNTTESENPKLELSKGKTARDSFIAGVIVNSFDKQYLTYPQVLDKERAKKITELHDKIKCYITSLNFSLNRTGYPDEVWDKLKSFGVYGMTVPEKYGGQGLTSTEFAKVIEAFGSHPSLATPIISHNMFVVRSLLKLGNIRQKKILLPKLASGELIGTFAMTEQECGSDVTSLSATAKLLSGDTKFLLKGEKIYVTNGERANFVLTVANLEFFPEADPNIPSKAAAFFASTDLPEVTKTKSHAISGLKGSHLSTLSFKNLPIHRDLQLVDRGSIQDLSMRALNPARNAIAALALGNAKEAFNDLLSHLGASNDVQECQLIKGKLSDIAVNIYAMESVIYLTSAFEDVLLSTETLFESTASKLFCIKAAEQVLNACSEIYGNDTLSENHKLRLWRDDLKALSMYESPKDINSFLLSMFALKFVGMRCELNMQVLRDPLASPLACYRMIRHRLKYKNEIGKFDSFLPHFDPALSKEVQFLEFAFSQLFYGFEDLGVNLGVECLTYQVLLKRMADIISDVYCCAAVLSRTSASLKEGVSEDEQYLQLQMSRLFAEQVRIRLFDLLESYKIDHRSAMLLFEQDLGDKIIMDKEYSNEHPLMRNF